jgi:hypothetical protein
MHAVVMDDWTLIVVNLPRCAAALQQLSTLANLLVDLGGQFARKSPLNPPTQSFGEDFDPGLRWQQFGYLIDDSLDLG